MRIYEISCMSSGDDDDLDRISGRTMSYEVVAMTESPQLHTLTARRTCWTSYRLPRMTLVAQRSCHLTKAGQGVCGEEALARDLVYLSLMRYLRHIHFTHVNNAGTFTFAKIYTREN